MSWLDWCVLISTNVAIVGYGLHKARGVTSTTGFLKGDQNLPWYTVGLSVMATQASAVTFLSVPGQAFESGMGFIQFYFGLPLATVVIAAVFIPAYMRAKVFTAYEFLEQRFDVRVRVLAAILFLIQRGLAAGITIYAPAIVLSTILGWPTQATCIFIGLLVILYTVSGGTRVVSQTQQQQMLVIFAGLGAVAAALFSGLPDGVGLAEATRLAGATGRMNIVDTNFDPSSRYNIWSGLTGGFFLALSYFGTDQSQVQRYLAGGTATRSRLGLLFNGVLKVPMQFCILYLGILLFVFYLFRPAPLNFNEQALDAARSANEGAVTALEADYESALGTRRDAAEAYAQNDTPEARSTFVASAERVESLRADARDTIRRAAPAEEANDSDYVFLTFALSHLPAGIVGLLVAVILSAAMSSTASELNALGTTSTIDLYRRLWSRKKEDEESAPRTPKELLAADKRLLLVSRLLTAGWGLLALAFALSASLFDNLIEAVNILGSIFYGPILGIFVTAFAIRRARSSHVLAGAAIGQGTVFVLYFATEIGYLWFNVIGCLAVVFVVFVASLVNGKPAQG
ncbi:MAG: SSS family transporter [Polyangiales bacterium]|jgi:SSS family transporter